MQSRNTSLAFAWFTSLLAIVIAAPGCEKKTQQPQPATDRLGTVTLEISEDDAEKVRVIEVPDVAQGTTLEQVLRAVDDGEFVITGSGSTALVTAIGEQAMEGARGWTFTINGEFANQGIGVTELQPPTTVRWTYGEFQM